ncbi:hypothetical protein D3C72_1946600 [compost metagenome]
MPACCTSGIITGPSTRMVGVRSITMPTTSNNTIMAAISRRGCSISGPSISAICAGRSASVIMYDDTSAAAHRNITVAGVRAACTKTGCNTDSFSSRYTSRLTSSEYIAATTAASVGVKMPNFKPPMMITGSISAQTPSRSA